MLFMRITYTLVMTYAYYDSRAIVVGQVVIRETKIIR